MIPTKWNSGKAKLQENNKKIKGCQGQRWGEMNRQSTEGIQGSLRTKIKMKTLYDTIMIVTCHYLFI